MSNVMTETEYLQKQINLLTHWIGGAMDIVRLNSGPVQEQLLTDLIKDTDAAFDGLDEEYKNDQQT